MTTQEITIIKAFAAGNAESKKEAIAIYRKYLDNKELTLTNAMQFMAEVDNQKPDYILRNRYRRLLMSTDTA